MSYATMEVLKSILGLLVCLGPIVAIVIYLAWATRLPPCPNCKYGNRRKATTCSHCGEKLTPRQNT